MSHHVSAHRTGYTMVELLLVLAVVGVTAAVGVRQMRAYLDRVATRAAVVEAALAVADARDAAGTVHALTVLRVDTVVGSLTLWARGERLATHALAHQHGVRVSTTRDSIAFDVRGLGYGAANLTLVARRGAAADTLVTSRLGRTRY